MAYIKQDWKDYPDTSTPINAERLNHMEDGIADLYNAIFPVGQIVIKGDDADYSNWLGFTWERTAVGKVLVGYDSSDTDFNAIGKTGGEKEHTLAKNELPNGVIVNTAGTIHVTTSGNNTIQTLNTGNQPHNNMQPYQVVAYWKRVS